MAPEPRRFASGLIALACLVAVASGQAEVLPPAASQVSPGAQEGLAGENATAERADEYLDPAGQVFTMPLTQANPISVEASEEGLISLSAQGNVTLRQVLAAIAQTQGINLVVAAPADVVVTAEFKKMPLQEVLTTLLDSTGHTLTRRGGALIVTNVALGGTLNPSVQGRRVAVIELDFASAADLQPAIEGLLSPVGKSYFTETAINDHRRAKELLIVEDLDSYVTRIEHYVSQTDQAPRQVLIEAHLLQVTLDDDQRTGVDFSSLSRVSGAEVQIGARGFGDENASPGAFLTVAGTDLNGVIDSLISTTDAKTIASPRLLAVNGQLSQIQIGERLGYRLTTTTETSSLESVAFLDVGVVLSLTPRITRDGRVLLRVAPKVSTGAVNPDTGVPDEETTELETDALLNSGQGMIIGGLIQERDDTRISRVPVLGELPYVNALFRRRAVVKRRTELIVALTPHVLPYHDPAIVARKESQLNRVNDPLLHGPLCRNPRPYEARLYDPYYDEPRCHRLDRTDACDACGVASCPTGQDACGSGECGEAIRRLPPVAAEATEAEANQDEATEVAIRPQALLRR